VETHPCSRVAPKWRRATKSRPGRPSDPGRLDVDLLWRRRGPIDAAPPGQPVSLSGSSRSYVTDRARDQEQRDPDRRPQVHDPPGRTTANSDRGRSCGTQGADTRIPPAENANGSIGRHAGVTRAAPSIRTAGSTAGGRPTVALEESPARMTITAMRMCVAPSTGGQGLLDPTQCQYSPARQPIRFPSPRAAMRRAPAVRPRGTC
jgi:hypothetical protein